jgi:hypothetical protein
MTKEFPEMSRWEDDVRDDHPPTYNDLYGSEDAPDYDSDASWDVVKAREQDLDEKPSAAAAAARKPRCNHWNKTGCVLGSGLCCACSDKRPLVPSDIYATPADARSRDVRRVSYYCPGCKEDAEEARVRKETELWSQRLDMHLAIQRQQRANIERQVPENRCEHWLERWCSLTAYGGQCCSCSDQRPRTKSKLYPAYVDGRGGVMKAQRWDYYCPGCKNYEELAQPPDALAASQAAARRAARRATKPCPHFGANNCSMTSSRSCCACMDRRPISATLLYLTYVDGTGFVKGVRRWAHYCPGCKAAHDRLHATSSDRWTELQKPCDHWIERRCAQPSNPKICCACSDTRPIADTYAGHFNGAVWVKPGKRWESYCSGCKGKRFSNLFFFIHSIFLNLVPNFVYLEYHKPKPSSIIRGFIHRLINAG